VEYGHWWLIALFGLKVSFADDVVVLLNGKFLKTISVQRWCEQVELSVNPSKTTPILFTTNRSFDGFIKTKLFGNLI
jgi:hypothetical protein